MNKYSIIITFYNGANLLKSSLHNLTNTTPFDEVELIIVNDNPKIEIQSIIDGFKQLNIKYIHNKYNNGYSEACNIGAQAASGEYLVFMDSDIITTKNWLTNLQNSYDNNIAPGAVGSKILDLATGKIQYFGIALYEVEDIAVLQNANRFHKYALADKEFNTIQSGCMLIKKDLFRQVHGFDKHLFNAHDDLDISYKIREQGYKCYISASSEVYHRGGSSGGIRYVSVSSAHSVFFKRWNNRLINDAPAILNELYSYIDLSDIDKRYIIINLSMTVYSEMYVDCLKESLNIEVIDVYNLKPDALNRINLMDFLSWDLCMHKVGFIYLSNTYLDFYGNYFWFSNRQNKNDILADLNGNIFMTKHIFNIEN